MLSPQQMKEAIEGGGSVLVNNRLITRVEDLPKAEELAQTEEEKAAAAAELDAQIAELQRRREALGGQSAAASNDETGTGDAGSDTDDTLEELMRHKRDDLVQKAQALGIEVKEEDTKTVIAGAILAKQAVR